MATTEKVSLLKGPSLCIRFTVCGTGISEIALELSKEKGFSWTLEGIACPETLKESIAEWMNSYSRRKPPQVRLPLVFKNIPAYTSLVLSTVQQIPFGNVLSYGEVAQLTGNPKSARAVGNACGSNPFPLIIPCHRVLAQGNKLGGFSCSVEIKKLLLDFEKINYS